RRARRLGLGPRDHEWPPAVDRRARPAVIYPLTVQAERLANKAAVVDDRPDGTVTTWTFAELNRRANRLAHVFRELGLEAGERFVWCGPDSPGVVVGGYARAQVGAISGPVN